MNISFKNKLQEIYQKQNKKLPKYSTYESDKKLLWISEVELYDGKKYIGDLCKRKNEAEETAATYAFNDVKIEKLPITNKYDLPRTVILVDIENMPKIIDELYDVENMDIYGFIGENHHLVKKEYGDKVIKIISPSNRKDGTDTCMQVYVGYLLMENNYDRYIVATKDHYGPALADIITTNNFSWKNKIAKVITDISQLSI